MKKTLLFLVCLIATSKVYAFKPMLDLEGIRPFSIQDVGVKVLTVGYTTTSGAVQGSSVAIYGVLTSTAVDTALSQFALIRSTSIIIGSTSSKNTANLGELLVPEIVFASTTHNTFIEYDPPVIAPDGFSLSITSIADSASVFYQFLATGTQQRYRIPIDDRDGVKTYSTSLYGVKAATTVTPGATANAVGTEALDQNGDELVIFGSTRTDSGFRREVRGFLYGWQAGTGTVTNYVIFRDTNSVGNTADLYMPPIFYNTFTVGDRLTGSPKKNSTYRFPWPVIFETGLTQDRNQADDRFRVFAKPAETLR